MDRITLIDTLIVDTQAVKAAALDFQSLDDAALNFKPNETSWSVLECLEHLNIADAHYLRQFDLKLEQAPVSNRNDFKSGWLGNYFVKSMKPQPDGTIPSPMKTMKKFLPEVNVQYDTMSKFIEDQDSLMVALEKSKRLDLNKIKIASAIGSIVTFRLGDAFRFLIAHNQRHILQAQNVLKQMEVMV